VPRLRVYPLAVSALILAACSSGHPAARARSTTSTSSSTTSTSSPTTTSSSLTSTTLGGPAGGPVPAGFQPESVTFVSAQRGWVLGSAPCSHPVCTSVLRTTDGGRTWAGIPAPAAPLGPGEEGSPGVAELRFADPLDGWAFGSELWSTHDGGAHWKQVHLPGAQGLPASVVSLEAGGGEVYALDIPGTQQSAGTAAAQLYQTGAGADAWTPVTGASVPAAEAGRVVVSGSGAWVDVQTSGAQAVFLARGTGGWNRHPLPCGQPSLTLAAVSATDMATICAGGGAAGQQPKQLYSSSDAGLTWHPVSSGPMAGDTLGAAMASPSVVVVAAASGASFLYGTFDAGRSWSTVYQDTSGGGAPWRDLGFTDPSQGVVVEGLQPGTAGLPPNRLLMTRDGGHTWATVTF
jgi:photosystem II stability/assembly factor-like uncharacterized protein